MNNEKWLEVVIAQQKSIEIQAEQIKALTQAIGNMASVVGEMLDELTQQQQEDVANETSHYMDGTSR